MLLTNLDTHTGFIHEINNERIKSNVTSVKVDLVEGQDEVVVNIEETIIIRTIKNFLFYSWLFH